MNKLERKVAEQWFIEYIKELNKQSTEFDCKPLLLHNIAARSKVLAYIPYNPQAVEQERLLGIEINELSFRLLNKKRLALLLKNKYILESKTKKYRFSKKGGQTYLSAENTLFGRNLSFQNSISPVLFFKEPDYVRNYLSIDREDIKKAKELGAFFNKKTGLWYCIGEPNKELKKLSYKGLDNIVERLDDDTPVYYVNLKYSKEKGIAEGIRLARQHGLTYDRYHKRWYIKAVSLKQNNESEYKYHPLLKTLVTSFNSNSDYLNSFVQPFLPDGIEYIKTRKPSTISLVSYYELKLMQFNQLSAEIKNYDLGKIQSETDKAILYYAYPNDMDYLLKIWIPKDELDEVGKVKDSFMQLKLIEMSREINKKIKYIKIENGSIIHFD